MFSKAISQMPGLKDPELNAMLDILIKVSKEHFSSSNFITLNSNIYNRAIASVRKSNGEKHLICVVSLSNETDDFHVEELLAEILYTYYGQDEAITKKTDNKIEFTIEKLFFDVQPCDVTRRDHNCQTFFHESGRPLVFKEKLYNIQLKPQFFYWHLLLSSFVNFEENTEATYQQFNHFDFDLREKVNPCTWEKCYFINYEELLKNAPLALFEFNLHSLSKSENFKNSTFSLKRKREEDFSFKSKSQTQSKYSFDLSHDNRFHNETIEKIFMTVCEQYKDDITFFYSREKMQGRILSSYCYLLKTLADIIQYRLSLISPNLQFHINFEDSKIKNGQDISFFSRSLLENGEDDIEAQIEEKEVPMQKKAKL